MAALQTLDERLSRTEPIVSSLSDCAPACVERAVLVVVPQLSLTHPLPPIQDGHLVLLHRPGARLLLGGTDGRGRRHAPRRPRRLLLVRLLPGPPSTTLCSTCMSVLLVRLYLSWLYHGYTSLGERAQGHHPAALRLHSAHLCGSRVEKVRRLCSAFGQLLALRPLCCLGHLSAPELPCLTGCPKGQPRPPPRPLST